MENILLPEYPQNTDIWRELQKEKRHIVVYGMGNGADKLISQLLKYGLEVSDFFASDGFVRGHSFHGKRVLSFSEIKEKYENFVILVSFASKLPDVIERIYELSKQYTLYVPDMPVVDECYFTSEFYNENYDKIKKAYDLLEDNYSKKLFSSVIKYKLSGDARYLSDCVSKDECYGLLNSFSYESVVDAGAYNGDTAKEFCDYFKNLKKVYAIEPDPKNCAKLRKYAETVSFDIEVAEAALWSEDGEVEFLSSKNRNSSISNASYQHKTVKVKRAKLDSIVKTPVDYIKFDVEGAEKEALEGSIDTINAYKPDLLVSLYHKSEDIFSLVNYVSDNFSGYKLYMRRLYCLPAWELNLYAIKDNK
ncbi:MAG: FkbM family methyltransferase [Clostridia bacterium]|nr:FkbM family methyltransferase [Clostridia bacterium]